MLIYYSWSGIYCHSNETDGEELVWTFDFVLFIDFLLECCCVIDLMEVPLCNYGFSPSFLFFLP